MRTKNKKKIELIFVFFGDGAMNQGGVRERLN